MVMGFASTALVSKPPTAPTFAVVMKDGMVQSAMCQVALGCFSIASALFICCNGIYSCRPLGDQDLDTLNALDPG